MRLMAYGFIAMTPCPAASAPITILPHRRTIHPDGAVARPDAGPRDNFMKRATSAVEPGTSMRFNLLNVLVLFAIVVAGFGTAHATNRLPKDIVGLWCSDRAEGDPKERSYLRNDASAEKPDTPCREGSKTE
jgi:hypothetical protein